MVKALALIVIALTLVARPIGAAEPVVRDCWNRESHAAASECFENAKDISDEALAAEVRRIRHAIKTRDEEPQYAKVSMRRLEEAIAAFRAFTREQCGLEASAAAGGNSAHDAATACEAEMNESERLRLRAIRAVFEGRDYGN